MAASGSTARVEDPGSVTKDVDIAGIRQEDAGAVCFATETARILPVTFEAIKAETNKSVMKQLLAYVENGWPQHVKQIQDPAVTKFFRRRDSLIAIKGCVFLGDRAVVPARYRQTILKELHAGHPGMARTKLLARSKVYWPGIDDDIERTIKGCGVCAVNSKTPSKCTLRSWPIPRAPWSRIHLDFAGPVNGLYYLVIVDALSNWPEIFKMTTITTEKTLECFEEVFSRQGLCDTLVSDNGPQLVSKEFENFCAQNGIDHIKTPPYHPQSNGQAERFVDLLKTGLKKLDGEGNVDRVLRKFLLCYRYTPSFALGMRSPFQLMNGREMKTRLDLLKPHGRSPDGRNIKMEQQFNKYHSAKWKEFEAAEEVFVKLFSNNSWKWIPGSIVKRCGTVGYVVLAQTPTGEREIEAHANHLKKRFTYLDNGTNTLLDEFDLAIPTQRDVEPEVHPESEQVSDEDSFEDAVEVQEAPCRDVREAEAAPRRSARANKGVPPDYYTPSF